MAARQTVSSDVFIAAALVVTTWSMPSMKITVTIHIVITTKYSEHVNLHQG